MNRTGVRYDVGRFSTVANYSAAALIRLVMVCGMDLPEPPADAADEAPDQDPSEAGPPAPSGSPALPLQSREDTDAGWGERPEPDDDERLYRDRPPHWEK